MSSTKPKVSVILTKLSAQVNNVEKPNHKGFFAEKKKAVSLEPNRWSVAERFDGNRVSSLSINEAIVFANSTTTMEDERQSLKVEVPKNVKGFSLVDVGMLPEKKESSASLILRTPSGLSARNENHYSREKSVIVKPPEPPIPTCSIFVMYALRRLAVSPFKNVHLQTPSASELSTCVEDSYCFSRDPYRSPLPELNRNDIIVLSPPRSGQTPVLKGIAMLLSGQANLSDQSFLDSVGVIGSSESPLPKTSFGGRKLFKSFMNLRSFIRAENVSRNGPKGKTTA
jgi:hypothetical protein